MIPLDAVSLAAAIIAFVDYGTKLTKMGHKMYKSLDGSTEEHRELRRRTVEMSHLSQSLTRSSPGNGSGHSSDETLLMQMTAECTTIAKSLEDTLNSLRVKATGPSRVFASAKQAFRTSLKADELSKLRAQLEKIQGNVNTCMLSIIRAELIEIKQHSSFANEAMRNLAVLQERQFQNLERELRQQQIIDNEGRAQTQQTLTGLEAKLNSLIATTRSTAILESLMFKDMDARYNIIDQAREKTFEWVFEEETTTFKTWLESSDDVFWISGKAGSGKSTLMKYLADHKDTRAILKRWADQSNLLFMSFYFWNMGSDMQKSQEGLLRSLLYQILCACPEKTKDAFPERWDQDQATLRLPKPWSRKELSAALHLLLKNAGPDLKICIFIDGLDEFHGQHFRLIDDLDTLAVYSNVKMCVSSRPWYEFQAKYGTTPHRVLRVEDLTKNDMRIFVEGELTESPRFQRLREEDGRVKTLADQIVFRADGVFLWTFLTVRSLLDGIAKGDRYDMLQIRLDRTPTDLNKLFSHIIDNIDEAYRPFTYRVLLMLAHDPSIMWNTGTLWYLPIFMKDPDIALYASARIPSMEEAEYSAACREGAQRLRAWCGDLLKGPKNVEVTGVGLDFAHRTVATYLQSDEVQQRLRDGIGQDFKPLRALCGLNLCTIAMVPRKDARTVLKLAYSWFKSAINSMNAADWCDDEEVLIKTLQEIVRLCETRWKDLMGRLEGSKKKDWQGVENWLSKRYWHEDIQQLYHPIVDALAAGKSILLRCGKVIRHDHMSQILAMSVCRAFACRRVAAVEELLRSGVDPNLPLPRPEEDGGYTSIWKWALTVTYPESQRTSVEHYIKTQPLMMWEIFLRHGADPAPLRRGADVREKLELAVKCRDDQELAEFLKSFDKRMEEEQGHGQNIVVEIPRNDET